MKFVAFILVYVPFTFAFTDVYKIDDTDGLGRRFDGIGGISGGGATSKLLMNYPEKQRNEILDYLFLPNYGASLHILKVEIGGDGQSTDGTEASHMHDPWDENYQRGYEWWLMVEAKKRNPDIKIYGLPWSFPGWLNPMGQRNPYRFPVLTSQYVVKWIQGAYTYYNVTVDFVGIWNEKDYDIVYIKTLRKELDKAGLQHVRVVAPDSPRINDWKISADILNDPELDAAVYAIGSHYPGTLSTKQAVETGKPLWASEDYSTFNDLTGGGCWARILNQNYVNGNMTGTISWNLIAAYYDTLPFTRDGLMTAESPWSGNYVVESPIWITAHTTHFTQRGWNYYRHGKGSGHFVLGGSYVSLTSPDGKDLTIVIETMSHDHSLCIRPPLPKYTVNKQNVKFEIHGQFANLTKLYMWKTVFNFKKNSSSTFFKQQVPVEVINGEFNLDLDVDVVITLTTVANKNNKSYPSPPPPAKEFPLPYNEDFENRSQVLHVPGTRDSRQLYMVDGSQVLYVPGTRDSRQLYMVDWSQVLHVPGTRDSRQLYMVDGSQVLHVPGTRDSRQLYMIDGSQVLHVPGTRDSRQLYMVDGSQVIHVPGTRDSRQLYMVDGSQVLHVPGTRDSRQLYMEDWSQVIHVPGTRDSRQLYMVDGSQVLHVPGTRDSRQLYMIDGSQVLHVPGTRDSRKLYMIDRSQVLHVPGTRDSRQLYMVDGSQVLHVPGTRDSRQLYMVDGSQVLHVPGTRDSRQLYMIDGSQVLHVPGTRDSRQLYMVDGSQVIHVPGTRDSRQLYMVDGSQVLHVPGTRDSRQLYMEDWSQVLHVPGTRDSRQLYMVDGSQVLHVPGTRDSRQLYMIDGSQVLHVPGTRDSRQLYMIDGSQVLHVPGTRDSRQLYMVDGSQVLHVPGNRDSRQLYMVDGSQVLHVPGTRDSRQLYMVDGSQVLHVPGTRDSRQLYMVDVKYYMYLELEIVDSCI
ncbi:hypothetical protein ACF0H5_008709 [Mactra antiquata]